MNALQIYFVNKKINEWKNDDNTVTFALSYLTDITHVSYLSLKKYFSNKLIYIKDTIVKDINIPTYKIIKPLELNRDDAVNYVITHTIKYHCSYKSIDPSLANLIAIRTNEKRVKYVSYVKDCKYEKLINYNKERFEILYNYIDRFYPQILFRNNFKFDYSLTKSGKPTSNYGQISYRCCNDICFTPNEKTDKQIRINTLKEKGNFKYPVAYDINSSIPNIINFLNNGSWNNHDVWGIIAEQEGLEREVIKSQGMRAIFGKAKTDKQALNQLRFSHMDSSDDDKLSLLICRKYLNNDYKNFLFLVESTLYNDVLIHYLKLGIRVINVYDAFYFDLTVPNDIDNVINQCAKNLSLYIDYTSVNKPNYKVITKYKNNEVYKWCHGYSQKEKGMISSKKKGKI